MPISAKPVGRVSIRVIPDATKFRNDLKLLLKRVENSMSANLQVTADTRPFEADMRKIVKDWDGKEIDLHAGLSSKLFTGRMKVLTRPRQVTIVAKVSKASAVKVATFFAAFSGARLSGDLVKNLSEKLMNLDRSLPRLAKVALGIASISAAGLQSIKGLAGVGAGIASIAGAGFAAPAIISALATGVGTLVVALKGAPKQLASLKPAMTGLQNIIDAKFWAGARKPIIDLTNSLLPDLRKGFAGTASELGGWAASIANAFQRSLGGGVLTNLFVNLNKSIMIATKGTDAFVTTLVTLGTVGGPYVVRLAQWIADLTNRFDRFVQDAAADGRLVGWIDRGIVGMKNLGSSIGSVVKILAGINRAASAAGGGGLAAMAATLGSIDKIVNSPAFQTALTTIFAGAAAGASGLASALAPIGRMFAVLAPVLSKILSSSGETVGKLLSMIADVLSRPEFQKGLGAFFAGIQQGLLAIGPSLPAVADALGALGVFAGRLAAAVGPVLGALLSALAPALIQILDALTPVLPTLTGALVDAINQIAPLLPGLISAIIPLLPPLVDFIANVLPGLITDVQILLPILTPLLYSLSQWLGLLAGLVGFGAPFAEFVSKFLDGGDRIGLLLDGLHGKFGPLVQAFSTVAVAAGTGLRALVATSTKNLNSIIDLINGLIDAINTALTGLKGITGGAINLKVPKIGHLAVPSLAQGATILPRPGGTLVRAGEAGRAEDVVDHGLLNRLMRAALSRPAAGGAPSKVYAPIAVTVAAEQDARVAGRQFGREFSRQIAGGV